MERLLGPSGMTLQDFRLVIPHQASLSGMELMRRKLDIPEDRWVATLPRFGNTIASAIPLALHEAIRAGRLKRGERVLMIGTSAGFSIGGVALEY
jgi:3-oxoacyl-[acyl-carrier-protein] synthase-3